MVRFCVSFSLSATDSDYFKFVRPNLHFFRIVVMFVTLEKILRVFAIYLRKDYIPSSNISLLTP